MATNLHLDSKPTPETDQHFFSGLVTGVALGAAAYYFFTTEEGRALKDHLLATGKDYLQEFQRQNSQPAPVAPANTLPSVTDPVAEPVHHKQHAGEASRKADILQQSLQQEASKIERKFFTRKGHSLKK